MACLIRSSGKSAPGLPWERGGERQAFPAKEGKQVAYRPFSKAEAPGKSGAVDPSLVGLPQSQADRVGDCHGCIASRDKGDLLLIPTGPLFPRQNLVSEFAAKPGNRIHGKTGRPVTVAFQV